MEAAYHKGKGARTLKNHNVALVSVFHSIGCRDPFEDRILAKPVSSISRMLMKPKSWISCLKNSVTFLQRKHFVATKPSTKSISRKKKKRVRLDVKKKKKKKKLVATSGGNDKEEFHVFFKI